MCGYGLSDSTVGIIGLGRIGKCSSESRFLCLQQWQGGFGASPSTKATERCPCWRREGWNEMVFASFPTQTILGLCDSAKVVTWCSPG